MLSIVVPCYNEEEGIETCHARLTAVLSNMGVLYEIIYIDDGSRDRTAVLLHALHAADPRVVVLRLSRNFGHQPAVSAGLTATRGQATIIIDADLQDPPELIPQMVALWPERISSGIRGCVPPVKARLPSSSGPQSSSTRSSTDFRTSTYHSTRATSA